MVITDVPGKRDALRRGWEVASTPLVALVDSDVVWATDVADQVCMPFVDPRVGGVSTRQNVYNPRGFLQRVNDMFLDYRYFDENAAQTAAGRAVSCISGRTAVYRRSICPPSGWPSAGDLVMSVTTRPAEVRAKCRGSAGWRARRPRIR